MSKIIPVNICAIFIFKYNAVWNSMIVYAFRSRPGYVTGHTGGEIPVEVFSDSSLDEQTYSVHKIPGWRQGLNHYAGAFSADELRRILSLDDVLGKYSEAAVSRISGTADRKMPEIMGIINMTEDSFYPESRFLSSSPEKIGEIVDNSDIVDVGGESTRPGAHAVSVGEEIERVQKAVRYIRSISDVPVSVDTMHPETVEALLRYDIDYINDVSGFRNRKMGDIAAREGLKCVVMHMIGKPETMMEHARYTDCTGEVLQFLVTQARDLVSRDVPYEDVIIDPGIGFSKNLKHNVEIIRNIESFRTGFRVLVGHSRKSFLGKIMENESEDRLAATLSTSLYLYEKGVDILRLHDPRENRSAIRTYDFLLRG